MGPIKRRPTRRFSSVTKLPPPRIPSTVVLASVTVDLHSCSHAYDQSPPLLQVFFESTTRNRRLMSGTLWVRTKFRGLHCFLFTFFPCKKHSSISLGEKISHDTEGDELSYLSKQFSQHCTVGTFENSVTNARAWTFCKATCSKASHSWGFGWVDKAQCFRSARRIGPGSSPDFSRVFSRHFASRHSSRNTLFMYYSALPRPTFPTWVIFFFLSRYLLRVVSVDFCTRFFQDLSRVPGGFFSVVQNLVKQTQWRSLWVSRPVQVAQRSFLSETCAVLVVSSVFSVCLIANFTDFCLPYLCVCVQALAHAYLCAWEKDWKRVHLCMSNCAWPFLIQLSASFPLHDSSVLLCSYEVQIFLKEEASSCEVIFTSYEQGKTEQHFVACFLQIAFWIKF